MRFTLLVAASVVGASYGEDKPKTVGPTDTGFLLPNGWHLTPAGKHVVTTDLPLNLLPLKDGKHVLVATSGYNKHELSLIDIGGSEPKVVSSETVRQSWYGLALDKAEGKVWWSGGGTMRLHTFDLKGSKLARTSPLDPEPKKETPAAKKEAKEAPPKPFPSGLCLDESRGLLYSLSI